MEERAHIPVQLPAFNPLPSYWHEPKCSLPSTPPEKLLKEPYDYAIIGSGITGVSIAHNLLKANPKSRILMIEARDLCSGATGRNGGHTKAASYRTYLQHKAELGKEEALRIARLEYATIVETHALAKELNLECESHLCNTVDIIYDAATFAQGKAAIEALIEDATEEERKPSGMADYKIYTDASEITQKFHVQRTNTNPSIPQTGKGSEQIHGAFEYLAGRIHAYHFTTSLLTHLASTHPTLHILTHTPVTSLTASPSSTPDNPLWTLQTSTHAANIKAHTTLLATNAYTPYLAPTFQSLIVPLRGQITAQSTPHSPLENTYSFIHASGYDYMIPRPSSGHVVIGGALSRLPSSGAEEYGTVDDSRVNPVISSYLRESLNGFFGTEEGKRHEVVHEWTGIMGATGDGRPFVGEVPGWKGVWVCAGFNGHGMVMCRKVAEGVVGMVRGVDAGEWFPGSFLVGEGRMEGEFGGRRDMRVGGEEVCG